ncbi:MAG TPA: ferritin-like domain-containing protein [Gemmatimonadales bacterium]|nr:ferritin-like domain-containing protein [Gemmatimonadales bacterium]
MEALQKLLQDELEDLYDAEQQILKALPKMIEGSSSAELQRALKQHLQVTQNQVTRLEQVFEQLGEKARKKPCKGMAGIIAEGAETLEQDLEESTLDAGIIAAAQKVEHYEIASYGTARTLAQTLGKTQIAELLEETLEEEKEADQLLTHIAESSINAEAASEEEEGEEQEGSRSGKGRSRSSQGSRSSSSRSGSRSKNRSTRRSRGPAKAGR